MRVAHATCWTVLRLVNLKDTSNMSKWSICFQLFDMASFWITQECYSIGCWICGVALLIYQWICWLVGWFNLNWFGLLDWGSDWVSDCFLDWLTDRLIVIYCFVDCSIVWSINWSSDLLIGHGLIDQLKQQTGRQVQWYDLYRLMTSYGCIFHRHSISSVLMVYIICHYRDIWRFFDQVCTLDLCVVLYPAEAAILGHCIVIGILVCL